MNEEAGCYTKTTNRYSWDESSSKQARPLERDLLDMCDESSTLQILRVGVEVEEMLVTLTDVDVLVVHLLHLSVEVCLRYVSRGRLGVVNENNETECRRVSGEESRP